MGKALDLPADLQAKWDRLEDCIRGLGTLAVGFSGGVDSALLLAAAQEALGDNAIAITAADASVPEREIREARAFCEARGIRHFLCHFDPLQEEGYRKNGPRRCYFCKKGIFQEILRIAGENGIAYVAEGSNMDDLGDYRPGLEAVSELSVKSPLREAGLKKAEIRAIAKALGLPMWKKPAYACLASRFAYGEEITEEKLRMLDQAEEFLIEHGFPEERVRLHGKLARIELPPQEIARFASDEALRESVCRRFRELGFLFVSLDLHGYRTGSMNALL